MKKSVSRIMALMIAAVAAFGMLYFSIGEVNAASGPLKMDKMTFWAGDEIWRNAPVMPADEESYDLIESARLISVKSSKPGVLEAYRDPGDKSIYGQYLVPKKIGKSKVTIKYKLKGKKYSMSRTYTVKKYPSPYKSIKVNGKKVTISKNKFSYDLGTYKKNSVKVKVTPKSGWKIISADVSYFNTKTNKETYKDLSKSVIKKGNAIKTPKGYEANIFLTMENKDGELIEYYVHLAR